MAKAEHESKSEHIISLAKDLLDDIELSQIPTEALLLKAIRLARLVGSPETQRWLEFEMIGYKDSNPISLEYMTLTGRWTNQEKKQGFWGSLAQLNASIETKKLRLQTLRIPNISSSGTAGAFTAQNAVINVLKDSERLTQQISQMTAIRGRVMALLHDFVARIYYEKVFSRLSESIFEHYKNTVDARIAERSGKVLEKLPAIYNRLAEGDSEAISQALNTCRRVIDAFADAIYPPTDCILELDGETLQLGPSHQKNRINAYICERVTSRSRRKRLRQTLTNLYGRVSTGVHDDITVEEAQSLFLQAYLFLGEVLSLGEPPDETATNSASNPSEDDT
ncbi:MAG: hypothetical protein ACE5IF_05390 [Candidatus Bathyarchaeia archaeon]